MNETPAIDAINAAARAEAKKLEQGKGSRLRRGHSVQAYANNYDRIFRKKSVLPRNRSRLRSLA